MAKDDISNLSDPRYQALASVVSQYIMSNGRRDLTPFVENLNTVMGDTAELTLARGGNQYNLAAYCSGGIDIVKVPCNLPKKLKGKDLRETSSMMLRAGIPLSTKRR